MQIVSVGIDLGKTTFTRLRLARPATCLRSTYSNATDLFLSVVADEEGEGGVELMRGTVIEKDHLLAPKLDRDRGNPAHDAGFYLWPGIAAGRFK